VSLPAVIRRLPRLHWRGGSPAQIVPDEAVCELPDLAPDLKVVARELVPAFCALDAAALRRAPERALRWLSVAMPLLAVGLVLARLI